jgi:hypothetical protein
MMFDRTRLVALLALATASLSGCDSAVESPGQTGDLRPDGSVTQPPQDPPANDPPTGGSGGEGSAALGPTCASSDPDRQCISVKLVSYESSGVPVVSEQQAVALIAGVNSIWAPCNIAFEIGEYVSIDPTTVGLTYGAGSQNELTSIRNRFSDNDTFLLVATGPWSGSYIAWTVLPGGGPYGAVVESGFANHAVTVAHELGHYMGLDHSGTNGNVLYPVVYSSNTSVTSGQCSSSRSINESYWEAMFR